MTEKDASELLKHHSFTHEDINNPKEKKGFSECYDRLKDNFWRIIFTK